MKARQVRGDNDTVTIVATEAITANRCVCVDGTHTVDKAAVGVALHDTDSGDNISVGCGTIERVESGGTCTEGGGLKADADGRVVDQGGSGIIVGYALDASSTAGDIIRMLLVHGGNTA
jgi:hypothetical protein